ncbi:MAG: GNAT family N-acetyltransferase [candidate division WOR-3 bacterium]
MISVIQAVGSFVRRALRPTPRSVWRPGRVGPQYRVMGPDLIRILEGDLAGRELVLTTELLPTKAQILASLDGQQVGRAYVERDPPGKGIILWDVAVKEGFRRKGIASIMVCRIFRELLAHQRVGTFRIRMIRLMKPADRNIELQNVGIGVIGNRLGFTPEFNLKRLLRPNNVIGIEVLPAKNGFPPSFKIVIKTFPLVLIAFVLDPDNHRPVDDFRTYVRLMKDERTVYDWVDRGLIVIGNGNYCLRSSGLDQFVNHLATDEFEARVFRRRVRGV